MSNHSLLFWFVTAGITLTAQENRLPFTPLHAEYSKSLDRVIMTSAAPPQLHIYDPVTHADRPIALTLPPRSLSLSPDGRYAAAGHADSASYVNLAAGTVDRIYSYPPDPGSSANSTIDVALGSQWLYALGSSGRPVFIQLSTGTAQRFYPPGGSGRLHPSEKAIYAVDQRLARYDVDSGPITQVRDARFIRNTIFCLGMWFSPDASRMYNGCGDVALQSDDPATDMAHITRLPGWPFRWITESAALSRIAIVPDRTSYGPTFGGGQLADEGFIPLLESGTYRDLGRIALPPWRVENVSYPAHGRWAFFESTGRSLYVIHEADSATSIASRFAIETYPLGNPSPCVARFQDATLSIGGQGGLRSVNVQAAPDCFYTATSTANWIDVVKGGSGTGDGALTVHVRANTTAAGRSANVSLGGQVLAVTQQPSATSALQQFSYSIKDAEFSKSLDRLVIVSAAPDELHLYDPVTRADQFVKLSLPPLSVSVRPDGLYAAVGHAGAISYVNLQTMQIEKVIPIRAAATDIVLTASGYAFSFASDQSFWVQIANGTAVAEPGGVAARLHPSLNSVYATNLGGLENGMGKFDIRQSPPAPVNAEYPYLTCGNVWTSEDASLFFTGCAQVYVSSENTALEGTLLGRLSGFSSTLWAAWIADSQQRQQIAALTGYESTATRPYSELHIYASSGTLSGRVQLANYVEGALTLPTRGKWVFWNKTATQLYVLSKVEGDTAPLSDSFLEVINPDTVAGCTVSLPSTSETFPSSSTNRVISVNAPAGCTWEATVPFQFSDWISLTRGATGSGNGTFTVNVSANPAFQSRTGSVRVSSQTLSITQVALEAFSVTPTRIVRLAVEGIQTVTVQIQNPQASFTLTSNAPWLTTGPLQTWAGGYLVNVFIAANTGPARTGTLTIGGQTVTVEQAGTAQPGAMRFVPLSPCRVVDTRGETGQTGAFGLPVMAAGTQRDFPLPQGQCNIPSNATAYSLNVTVVPRGALSYLTLFPTGRPRPLVSTLNSFDGRIKANAAIVPAGNGGAVSVFVTDTTDVILDVNGYFVDAATSNPNQSYSFFTTAPCRLVDTRNTAGPGGGPSLNAGQSRSFSIRDVNASCPFEPLAVRAYALNITAIPKSGSLAYLTVWPSAAAQPIVSTLNSFTGTIVANAAIVPAGTNGDISVFVTNAADVVIDMVGYFALPLAEVHPLSFYQVNPCRVLDTREAAGTFGGPQMSAGTSRTIPVPSSACGIPTGAQGYALNATVVPPAPLSFLTLWPTGGARPGVSTLNSFDGSVVANAAIVPAGTSGGVQAFVTDATHLILDVSGYFAP